MQDQDPELLRRLLRAKDHIDAAPQEPWSIKTLALVSKVSPRHFARSFKQAFGIPPHRYLLTRRIERAVTLLGDHRQSITDIAFGTGWSSLGSFGRTFHDIVGSTPQEMRDRQRNKAPEQDVPFCFIAAASRPDLGVAVSEKRRRIIQDKKQDLETEDP